MITLIALTAVMALGWTCIAAWKAVASILAPLVHSQEPEEAAR